MCEKSEGGIKAEVPYDDTVASIRPYKASGLASSSYRNHGPCTISCNSQEVIMHK